MTEGTIVCKCGCERRFAPRRFWQKFFNEDHRINYWKRIHKEKRDLAVRLNTAEQRIKKLEEQVGTQ